MNKKSILPLKKYVLLLLPVSSRPKLLLERLPPSLPSPSTCVCPAPPPPPPPPFWLLLLCLQRSIPVWCCASARHAGMPKKCLSLAVPSSILRLAVKYCANSRRGKQLDACPGCQYPTTYHVVCFIKPSPKVRLFTIKGAGFKLEKCASTEVDFFFTI